MTNTLTLRLKKVIQERLIKNKFIFICFLLSFFINLLLWAFLFWRIKPQETLIYLQYNIYFGINLIGPWYKIYLIPLSGLLFFLINLAISIIIHNKEKMVAYFLMLTSVLCQVFLWIGAIFIVYLNL